MGVFFCIQFNVSIDVCGIKGYNVLKRINFTVFFNRLSIIRLLFESFIKCMSVMYLLFIIFFYLATKDKNLGVFLARIFISIILLFCIYANGCSRDFFVYKFSNDWLTLHAMIFIQKVVLQLGTQQLTLLLIPFFFVLLHRHHHHHHTRNPILSLYTRHPNTTIEPIHSLFNVQLCGK